MNSEISFGDELKTIKFGHDKQVLVAVTVHWIENLGLLTLEVVINRLVVFIQKKC